MQRVTFERLPHSPRDWRGGGYRLVHVYSCGPRGGRTAEVWVWKDGVHDPVHGARTMNEAKRWVRARSQ